MKTQLTLPTSRKGLLIFAATFASSLAVHGATLNNPMHPAALPALEQSEGVGRRIRVSEILDGVPVISASPRSGEEIEVPSCCGNLLQKEFTIGRFESTEKGGARFLLSGEGKPSPLAIDLTANAAFRLDLQGPPVVDPFAGMSPFQRKLLANLAQRHATDLTPAVCFAPGTPKETIDAFYAAGRAPGLDFFRLGTRWSSTATNGGGLQQGDPTILTWSFIPDGTNIPGGANGAGEPAAPSNLFAVFNGIYGGNPAIWRALFQQVFDRWSELTGLRYVYQPTDDGAAFLTSPGVLGVRGDLRIGGHFIDGNSNILAYNFFPNTGDMVIDTADNFYADTANNSLRLRNVVSHEHGHGMGLNHVCPVNGSELMEPFVNLSFDGPQIDDRLAGNRGYGDAAEPNDTAPTAVSLGAAFGNGSFAVQNLSIDDNGDTDFLRFNVTSPLKSATVVLSPVGATYLEGAQNGDGGCSAGVSFNSLIINDLGVQLFGSDGTTLLATANANPAGQSETLASIPLPNGTGPYYIRVFGGAVDNAQLYSVNLTIADTPNTPVIQAAGTALLAENCAPPSAAVDPGETVTVNFALKNLGGIATSNLVATLQATGGVTLPSGPQSYGAIPIAGATATRSFTFTASGACGGTLTATFQLQDGANNLGTVSFPFQLGTLVNTTVAFSSAAAVTIPSVGIASPYPSQNAVSGVINPVTKVTARLNGLTHTWLADIDVLLVSPLNQKVMLLSDAGDDGSGTSVSNITLTFDDAAAFNVPQSTPVNTGTYTPTDYQPGDTLTAPAPVGPYGTALSALNGANPNGTWSLYASDDFNGDSGTIGGGWTLDITTSAPSCCTGPLLQLVNAVSRRTHGAAGNFDTNLPLAGGGIECRSGNANTLIFTFSSNIASASGVQVTASSGTPAASIASISGNTIVVGVTGVTSVQALEVTLLGVTDVNGATLVPSLRYKVLQGDVNAGSSVNIADVNLTRAASSPGTVDATNFRRDVNASGSINISDVNIVRANSGNSLP